MPSTNGEATGGADTAQRPPTSSAASQLRGGDSAESPDGFGAELAKSIGVEHEQLLAQLPSSAGMLSGRLVEPLEVATLVTYLASPLAASTTGTDHLIDAGSIKTV